MLLICNIQYSKNTQKYLDHTLGTIFSVVTVSVTKLKKSKTNQSMYTTFPHNNGEVNIKCLCIKIVISHLDYRPEIFEGDRFRDTKTIMLKTDLKKAR